MNREELANARKRLEQRLITLRSDSKLARLSLGTRADFYTTSRQDEYRFDECLSCRHWHARFLKVRPDSTEHLYVPLEDHDVLGECRVNPPSVGHMSRVFPVTDAHDFCGEFELRQDSTEV